MLVMGPVLAKVERLECVKFVREGVKATLVLRLLVKPVLATPELPVLLLALRTVCPVALLALVLLTAAVEFVRMLPAFLATASGEVLADFVPTRLPGLLATVLRSWVLPLLRLPLLPTRL